MITFLKFFNLDNFFLFENTMLEMPKNEILAAVAEA